MKSESPDLTNVLDQSVLASLQQLQDEGDPDIVAEMGGLSHQSIPDKVRAIQEAAEKSGARALRLSAHSLKSSSACIYQPCPRSWR